MRNAGLEEAQAGIKISRRNISNLRYADDTSLMAETEEELESLFMKVKVESEKLAYNSRFKTEKAMAPHTSTLAWKIPWTEEPGGLQSMGSLRIGHD